MNHHDSITVAVQLDAGLFRRFALFDTLIRQKRWAPPALFFGIMLFFSLICFSLYGQKEQAALLGGVLLAVGLLLPAGYLLSFWLSIRAQIKKLGLRGGRQVYTVTLDPKKGIAVSAGKERALRPWDQVHGVYAVKDCIYLYVTPRQAYLLPLAQVEGGEESLRDLLRSALPPQRLHGFGRGKA